jgi:hypothetical protein
VHARLDKIGFAQKIFKSCFRKVLKVQPTPKTKFEICALFSPESFSAKISQNIPEILK